jgi:hypothetical protein
MVPLPQHIALHQLKLHMMKLQDFAPHLPWLWLYLMS